MHQNLTDIRESIRDKIFAKLDNLDLSFLALLNGIFGEEWIKPITLKLFICKRNSVIYSMNDGEISPIWPVVNLKEAKRYIKKAKNNLDLNKEEKDYLINYLNNLPEKYEIVQ